MKTIRKTRLIVISIVLLPLVWLAIAFLVSTTIPQKASEDLRPKEISLYYTVADYMLKPVMSILGGFRADSMQHTHPWHVQEVDLKLINPRLATPMIQGDDTSRFDKNDSFLFHAPIFGGWKKYSIYEISTNDEGPYYIGFVQDDSNGTTDKAFEIELPIYGKQVRMLNGLSKYKTGFFAVDSNGKQISVKKVGENILGSGADASIPLY